MSLKRKEIRHKLRDALTGKTKAGRNVRVNRSEVQWEENLPGLNIQLLSEDAEERTQAPRELKKTIPMVIEVVASGKDGDEVNDCLDELCEEVETCIAIDDSLSCTVNDIIYTGCQIDIEPDGEVPIGAARMTFNVEYYEFSPRNNADQTRTAGITNFTGVDAEYSIANEQAENDRAKDTVNVP